MSATHSKLPTITDDMEEAFRAIVAPVLARRRDEKCVRAEELKSAILARAADAKLLRITKAPGYGILKVYMASLYNARYVATARLTGHAHPVTSCFHNPDYTGP